MCFIYLRGSHENRVRSQESGVRSQRAGFTLVELAIVLVIVGLLIGMGAGLLGPLTKRAKLIETRNTVKEVYETINGYAAANKTDCLQVFQLLV